MNLLSWRKFFPRKLLIPAFCTVIIFFLVQLGGNMIASAQSPTTSTTYQPLSQIPATAQQVRTGIYTVNLYDINPSSNTYYIDFYMWFKWKGEIDPVEKLEFTNGVEDWSLTKEAGYENPEKLPDGSFYQVVRTEGRFREPFLFTRYPLDRHSLKINLENSLYTTDQLVYVAENDGSGYAEDLSVPGWKIQNYQMQNLVHEYASSFGDPSVKQNKSTYSSLRYELLIFRPLSLFIWKLLLPLLIVIFSSWGALLLYPLYVDSRIILPATALLTIVFLQQSYSDALPDVGYLVLLDKIYALAYVLNMAAILEAIITANWVKSEKPEEVARIIKVDRYFLIGNLIVLVVGVALVILLS